MNEMLQAGIYLNSVLPLMEDLVQYDRESAAAIKDQNLVLQLEVRGGPVAHLDIRGGMIRHTSGPHPRPDVHAGVPVLRDRVGSCSAEQRSAAQHEPPAGTLARG